MYFSVKVFPIVLDIIVKLWKNGNSTKIIVLFIRRFGNDGIGVSRFTSNTRNYVKK